MSDTHSQPAEREDLPNRGSVGDGIVAGFLGGIVMGLVLQFGTDVLPAVGALSGEPSLVVGWLVHLATSTVFGAAFAVLVSLPLFDDISRSFSGIVLLGIVHATVLATVVIALLPFAMALLGAAEVGVEFRSQLVPGPGLAELLTAAVFGVAHLVYGAILGVTYAILRDRA